MPLYIYQASTLRGSALNEPWDFLRSREAKAFLSSFQAAGSPARGSPLSTSLTSTDPHRSHHLGIQATENFWSLFSVFTAPEEGNCPAALSQQWPAGGRSQCPGPGLQLPLSSASFGPLSAQLLIINNTVYLYQNHYLNWLHDTCCSPNCTPGKLCYKICDFVLCNYPSMGYKALLWCLK